jgi:hypothetical protein
MDKHMRIGLSWRERVSTAADGYLLEVVTPRTNAATLTSSENFFASMVLAEPYSVELAADSTRRRFLVRATTSHMRDQLVSQLSAAYPQAELRVVSSQDDPARHETCEQFAACTLDLRAPAYLPLRTFTDLHLDGERAAQADPMLGIVSALGDLPAGWRGLSQLVLQRAPEDWCRPYQRLSVQHPLEHERVPSSGESAAPMLALVSVLLGVLLVGLQAGRLLRAELWLQLGLLLGGSVLAAAGVLLLVRRLRHTNVYDMELVREKVTRVACRAELRLVVFAPSNNPPSAVRAQLERLASAYRRFNLAAANGFVPARASPDPVELACSKPWRAQRRLAMLTTLELAGLWHLPHAAADVALLERTSARRWLPLPATVAEGCCIGVAEHQGRQVPVALPTDALHRHLLMVAKTRRGKSTLMQRLAHYAMQAEPRRAVLLVDPHRDLAESLLGLVPPERCADVVYLNAADRVRAFGLNLLDTGLGWDRDRAVNNVLQVFMREWGDRFWGPRMEDVFRYAVMTLFDANLQLCRADPECARSRQYTLLDLPILLGDMPFRREVLRTLDNPDLSGWWAQYYDSMDRRFQMEVINPVLSKVHRFEGSTPARRIIGQPVSTIDPAAWLRDGGVVIVNTARGTIGENSAALIGSTLLNLVALAVAEQAGLPATQRRPITMFVDEFHTIPGADYEFILAELAKYGANLVLATQSLARLLALGRDDGRGLRATVFANLDGLFAFNCSAEDAEYLVPELGGAINEQDLMELAEHHCYVRLSSGGKRLSTFSVHLDPPLVQDFELSTSLSRQSADRFGRDADLVDTERREAVTRAQELHTRAVIAASAASAEPPATKPARNEHRPRKKQRGHEAAEATPARAPPAVQPAA